MGATVGGWVYETFSARKMFGGMGVVVFITMFIFYFSDRARVGRELKDTTRRWWQNRQVHRSDQDMEQLPSFEDLKYQAVSNDNSDPSRSSPVG